MFQISKQKYLFLLLFKLACTIRNTNKMQCSHFYTRCTIIARALGLAECARASKGILHTMFSRYSVSVVETKHTKIKIKLNWKIVSNSILHSARQYTFVCKIPLLARALGLARDDRVSFVCKIPLLARRTRPKGYLVYKGILYTRASCIQNTRSLFDYQNS